MSTRGFLGFIVGDETTMAYVHGDSYPTWLGEQVAKFAYHVVTTGAETATAARVTTLRKVDEDDLVPAEERADGGRWHGLADGTDWYEALRSTQGDPEAILATGIIADRPDVPYQSDVQWGYLINFDLRQVEVYHRQGGRAQGRFSDKPGGITLYATWSFDKLPTGIELHQLELTTV